MRIQTILCPVDFSQMSQPVIDYAVFMAQTHQAQLKLLHVVDQLQGFDGYQILYMTAPEITAQLEEQTREQLLKIIGQLPIPATYDIAFGRPADEIVNLAERDKVDLIVMGSHGRSALAHLLVGSVAEGVVRHANTPVLVVREEG